MNAETLLDSLKIRQSLDAFSAAWRSKTATEATRIQAFQEVLDLIVRSYNLNSGSSKGRTAGFEPANGGSIPSPERPILKAKPDMDLYSTPEQAGIESFDPFRHPEEQAAVNPVHAELLAAHERTKNEPVGTVVRWKLSEDFNPNRAQSTLNELGLPYNVVDGGTMLDTTLSLEGRGNAPAPGWIVTLQKAE